MTEEKTETAKRPFLHQKRYTQRQKSIDRTRVNVWVPTDSADTLKAIAKDMREGRWHD